MQKNILLLSPWIYDFTAYDFWLRPLGLLQLASILREHTGARLHFIDCLDRNHPLLPRKGKTTADGRGAFPKEEVAKPDIFRNVPRKYSRYGLPLPLFFHELESIPRPDVVLVTCAMTYWYPGAQLAIELVRNKFGSVPVVLGGIYATLMSAHAKRHSGADFVVPGPAENKILPLLREILGDGWMTLAEFDTLDEVPFPALDLLRNKEGIPLLTSRGCPFRCTFCASPMIHKKFEQRLPNSVTAEIENYVCRFGARNFAFYDDALLLNKKEHIIPILEAVVGKNLDVAFHTPNGLHIKEIDLELARLFRRAGVRSLYLSQESVDDNLLAQACPKVSSGDLERALAALEKAGYFRPSISVYLIVGLPGQSAAGIRESILHVLRLGAKPRLAFYSPLPGTEDWRRLIEKGALREDSDPLLHNKLTFPYLWGDFSSQEFEDLRNLLSQNPGTRT